MFILAGDLVPKQDWRSVVALCFVFFLLRYGATDVAHPYLRPDPFPEVLVLH